RALRSHRTLAIQNRALAIAIEILRGELALPIGVQIPAVDPVRSRIPLQALRALPLHTLSTGGPDRTRRARRPRGTVKTLRAHRSERARGTDRPRRTDWPRLAHQAHRTRGARWTGRTLRPPAQAQLNFPRFAPLADVVALGAPAHDQTTTRGHRRCAADTPQADQAERQLILPFHAICPFFIVSSVDDRLVVGHPTKPTPRQPPLTPAPRSHGS